MIAHLGDVFLNGKSMYEVQTIDEVKSPKVFVPSWDQEFTTYVWHAEQDEKTDETVFYANFQDKDPNKENIEIDGVYFDLLIASYLVDSSLKNKVDIVMNVYGVELGEDDSDNGLFAENNPKRTSKIAFFSKYLEKKVMGEIEKISATDSYRTLEIPLVTTLADMEIEGFPLDKEVLDQFGDVYKAKMKALEDEIYEMAGEKFNIASPKQIGEILFTKLGLKGNKKMSTSVDVLKDLVAEHPIVSKILEYRKYFKLVSTYVEGLKAHIYKDGKIHAKFNQALTQTGRLSSSEPNLQNISVRDEEGKQIRRAFYYPDENYEIQ